MKEFQSVFRNELEEYLKINQGTVNEDTLRNTRRVLLSFDSSLAEENTNVISEAAVNRWIREIRQTNAAKQLGRQTYRPENLSDRHGVLYAAADAPWVRVPAG